MNIIIRTTDADDRGIAFMLREVASRPGAPTTAEELCLTTFRDVLDGWTRQADAEVGRECVTLVDRLGESLRTAITNASPSLPAIRDGLMSVLVLVEPSVAPGPDTP